jgi:arylsulfatase A-like enzyme
MRSSPENIPPTSSPRTRRRLQAHREPFFLYLRSRCLTWPPGAGSLEEYEGAFPETPYKGEKGYLPHWAPRAAYAAMITRMDREVRRLVALLKEFGLDERTLVLFSSDNGATIDVGGADTDFFESNAPLRGKKTMVYEGGIRVPLIARWPGRIKPGWVTEHVCAFEDYLPTFCEAAGVAPAREIDGLSFLPTLLGEDKRQAKREYLYWESSRAGRLSAGRLEGHSERADRDLRASQFSRGPGREPGPGREGAGACPRDRRDHARRPDRVGPFSAS